MAGIPSVMRAMLASLQSKLTGGAVLQSRSLTALLPESAIAAPFAALQARCAQVEMGSYPFTRDGRHGTTLVLRSSDVALLDVAAEQVNAMIMAAGGTQ